MHWAVSTRQLSLIIALGIHLSLIGCSAKKSAHTVESQDAAKVTPSSDGGLDPLERSRLLRKTRASSESPSTPDYRTAFRAVLSAGYRVRPKNLETVSVKQCQSAFNSLLTQPDVVLPFLTKKLTDGRIFERPLAIKLLGRLGKTAESASRHISEVAIRSWKIQFNRCLKEKINWSKGMGQELDAHPDVRSACRRSVMKKSAGAGVQLACEALTRIDAESSRTRLIASGVGGRFIEPCVPYLIGGELTVPEVLAFIAEEAYRPVNSGMVINTLIRRQAEGLRAALKIDEMRRASDKYVGDGSACLLGRLVSVHDKNGALGAIKAGLEPSDFSVLETLAKPPENVENESAQRAAQCISSARDVIKNARPQAIKGTERISVVPSNDFEPFCPTRVKGQR